MEHYIWIIYVFIYSFLKGTRDGMKKASLKKSSADEILFFYSLFGFILILPFSGNAFETPPIYIFYCFIKSLVICVAWLFAYFTLKEMTVSLYGIMDLSRMVFSTLLGVFVLGETLTFGKLIGVILVILGLVLVNTKSDSGNKKMRLPILMAALSGCFLNAISGMMDKILMKDMEAEQLQFWFMLFLIVLYGGIIAIKKEKISLKSIKTNYWIPLMSLSLVFGDRLLFTANKIPESQVTVMTVIKQSAVIITVFTGWIFFKEKNILFKLLCCGIIICGIVISILGI